MPKEPIFWNRCEDINFTSVIGPDMTYGGTPLFSSSKFGNGVSSTDPSDSYRIDGIPYISQSVLNEAQGCIEFWVKASDSWASKQMLFLDNIAEKVSGTIWYCFWQTDGRIYMQMTASCNTGVNTINSGDFIHLAFVWNASGIDGSANTQRIYVNGVSSASTNSSIAGQTFDDTGKFRVGVAWDDSIGTIDRSIRGYFDNIKVFDYSKTDFSDRLSERGGMNDLVTF
jgi:hypothetical protein